MQLCRTRPTIKNTEFYPTWMILKYNIIFFCFFKRMYKRSQSSQCFFEWCVNYSSLTGWTADSAMATSTASADSVTTKSSTRLSAMSWVADSWTETQRARCRCSDVECSPEHLQSTFAVQITCGLKLCQRLGFTSLTSVTGASSSSTRASGTWWDNRQCHVNI